MSHFILEPSHHNAYWAGLRSFLLGYGIRSGVDVLVLILRHSRKRRLDPRAVLYALFGPDSLRMGCLLGGFSFLYKQALYVLYKFNPGHKGKRHEEPWHAAVAGALSGLAVLAEKHSRRITIGQQLAVRGLQGYYNGAKARGWVNIPHGDVLVFGLASAQIMYSWLMSPESLPSSYRAWILNASRVNGESVKLNRSMHRHNTFDPKLARALLSSRQGATARNATLIETLARGAEVNGDFGPPFAPCELVHPWVDSCSVTALDRFQSVFKWISPVYLALHVIPAILLRRKVFLKDPAKVLRRSIFGTMRSSAFLSTFVVIFQGLMCSQRNLYYAINAKAPAWLLDLVAHRLFYWFAGMSTCLALFLEEKRRRDVLALYVLPRGAEAFWSSMRKRAYVPFVPGGEVLLTCAGASMVMSTYRHEPEMLGGLMRRILFQFVGLGANVSL